VLSIMLLATRFGIPICPHAGGVGLCEYVQHLAIFDYIALSGTLADRVCEYVDHLHEHFVDPVRIVNGRYAAPTAPGYSITMKAQSLADYEFPNGREWRSAPAQPTAARAASKQA
jgi:L-fuconate dehydratase